MKQYLDFRKTSTTYSFKHSFNLIFRKIETVFFSFLCVIFLITSRLNSEFSKNVSFLFVDISMPVVEVAAFPFNAIINLLANFNELIEAKKENKILKNDLTELRTLYIKSLNINQENKELRNILNFISSRTSTFKVARIIGRSHQLFNQELFVDIGKNRDVKQGSIVTGNRGVIGRISEIGEDKSRLLLLTDASSRIPVITSKSRMRGVLAGNNSGAMEMLYLPKNSLVEVGDWVFTSGDGDTLPPGLLVGVVKKVDKGSVLVVMVEDISNTDIVTITEY